MLQSSPFWTVGALTGWPLGPPDTVAVTCEGSLLSGAPTRSRLTSDLAAPTWNEPSL